MHAAIYTRLAQLNGGSIERQRTEAFAIAADNGHEVTHEFTDTGAGTGFRPGFERMIDAVILGEVEVIVASRLDRLTRNPADVARLVNLGVPIVTREVDTTSATGQAALQLVSAFAVKGE